MDSSLKKKIVLIFGLFIVLLVSILNSNKIKLGIDTYKIYKEEKKLELASDGSDYDPDSQEEIANPLTDLIESKPAKSKAAEEEEIREAQLLEENELLEEDKDKASAEPKAQTQAAAKVSTNTSKSYINIVEDYYPKLTNLQASFQADLDSLVDSAVKDYRSGDYSNSKLFSSYLSSASQLETSSDREFSNLIMQMEEELRVNNHDNEIIGEITDYYNSVKTSQKRELISKGMSYLK